MVTTEVVRRRNAVALIARHHPDSPDLVTARRDLAAAKLEAYVQRVVSEAPPLTSEQRDRLAALLRPIPSGDAA
jgi:hypothetical protein